MGSKGSKGANEFSPSESSSTLSPNSSVSVSLSSLPPPVPHQTTASGPGDLRTEER